MTFLHFLLGGLTLSSLGLSVFLISAPIWQEDFGPIAKGIYMVYLFLAGMAFQIIWVILLMTHPEAGRLLPLLLLGWLLTALTAALINSVPPASLVGPPMRFVSLISAALTLLGWLILLFVQVVKSASGGTP